MGLQRVGHNWVHTNAQARDQGKEEGLGAGKSDVRLWVRALGPRGGLFSVNWSGQMALKLLTLRKVDHFLCWSFRTSDRLLSANTKWFLASGSNFSVSEDQNLEKAWPWPLYITGSRTALVSCHFILFKKNDLFNELKTFHKINAYKYPSTDEWMKMWYIYTKGYYSAIRKEWNMPFAATWMDLEIIILSEVGKKENNKYHMISLICGI